MSTDDQDRIVKQLENRYDRMHCEPQPDEGLKITAHVTTVGAVTWERIVVVSTDGEIVSDSGEYEHTAYDMR